MKTATSFKPGQARPPNAGRKKGTPNKARALLLDIATKELGVEPIVEMCRRYKTATDDKQADFLLKEITSYCYPKPKAIEISGQDGEPISVRVQSFDLDERAAQLKGEGDK